MNQFSGYRSQAFPSMDNMFFLFLFFWQQYILVATGKAFASLLMWYPGLIKHQGSGQSRMVDMTKKKKMGEIKILFEHWLNISRELYKNQRDERGRADPILPKCLPLDPLPPLLPPLSSPL